MYTETRGAGIGSGANVQGLCPFRRAGTAVAVAVAVAIVALAAEAVAAAAPEAPGGATAVASPAGGSGQAVFAAAQVVLPLIRILFGFVAGG